ncbi:hypothetical protein [Beduinella massiliensis]|uniref:hypothetical protein n=1 Tax=Beduinella massiliensis TaxID=1852363 RepID=UPI000C83D88D
MTDEEYNLIIVTIAIEHKQPIEQVLKDMQDAICDMFTNPHRSPETQVILDNVKRKEEIPTVREFIEFLEEAKRSGILSTSDTLN